MSKDFLHVDDWSRDQILSALDLAAEVKKKLKNREPYHPFKDHCLAMIFVKPSARTRVSFESGFFRLGGSCLAGDLRLRKYAPPVRATRSPGRGQTEHRC